MALGHAEAAWAHTSNLMALIAEVNRDPKKRHRPFSAEDFRPRTKEQQPKDEIMRAPITALKVLVEE